ncbi:hypothetical protein ACSSS7_007912 [Eimeria intestinalis]
MGVLPEGPSLRGPEEGLPVRSHLGGAPLKPLRGLVAKDVLSLDLPPPQLTAALATRLPLRGQALSQQQLSLAANRCSSSSNNSSSSSKGGATAAGDERAVDAKKLPVGVIIDVGHNMTAVDRLLQKLRSSLCRCSVAQVSPGLVQTVGHQHYGCPVRAVVCLSQNRSPELLLPFLAQLAFPQNNRLKCLHLASADHPRGREVSEVFDEIGADPRYSECVVHVSPFDVSSSSFFSLLFLPVRMKTREGGTLSN